MHSVLVNYEELRAGSHVDVMVAEIPFYSSRFNGRNVLPGLP